MILRRLLLACLVGILALVAVFAILYVTILFSTPCAVATEFIAKDPQARALTGRAISGHLVGASFNLAALLNPDTPLGSEDVFRIRLRGTKDSGVMEVVVAYDLGVWKVTAATYHSSLGKVVTVR
jgi:hypothetical protein